MSGLYGHGEREAPLMVVLDSPLREDRLQRYCALGGDVILSHVDDHRSIVMECDRRALTIG